MAEIVLETKPLGGIFLFIGIVPLPPLRGKIIVYRDNIKYMSPPPHPPPIMVYSDVIKYIPDWGNHGILGYM